MNKLATALLALMVTASLAVACGGDDGASDETATAAASPTEATTVPTATQTPTEAAGTAEATATATTAAAGPVSVRDLIGRQVEVGPAPQKIVTLSPSAIEILYAVGGEAIARSTTAAHPESVASLPDIGPAYQPDMEAVIALQPDLVIADASAQAHLADAITGPLGDVPVLFVGAASYDDVGASMRLLGQALGREAEAEDAVAAMDAAKAEAQSRAEGQTPPRVLIINGAPDDFFVALPDSFVGDMVRIAGGENVAAGQPPAGPYPGYTQLSLEAIIQADPEIILAITAGPPGVTLSQGILGETAYADVAAVRDGRVHELDLEVFLQAPGPRAADGLRELSDLLFPPGR